MVANRSQLFGGIHMQAYIVPPYSDLPVRRPSTRRVRRRVRRMVTILLLAVVLLFVAFRAVDMFATSEAPAMVTYTVVQGDTLWDIATAHNPGGDVRDMIIAIKRANGMETATVQPGQELVIPQKGR